MTKADELLAALRPAVRRLCSGEPTGILFSGGIDSTVVAKLAADETEVHLYTVGVGEAHDLTVAEETARALELPWTAVRISEDETIAAVVPLSDIIRSETILPVSFEMPAYFVCMNGHARNYLSGQGADELFGGYMRYLTMPPEGARGAMARDLEALLGVGISMEHAIARRFGKTIGHPYLDPHVVDLASNLTGSDCISGGARKVILGQVASLIGLDFLVSRQKKAAQYGSGIMSVLKAEAKRRGVPTSALVGALRREGQSV